MKDNLLNEGVKRGLIRIDKVNDRITYVQQGKNYKFSDPEEVVRAKTYIGLILDYKYPPKRIDMEVYAPRRVPQLPADIVVYQDDELENVYIVVETKANSTEKDIEVAKREGLGNSTLLSSDYLLCVCDEEELTYNVKSNPSLKALEKNRISQIPINYGLEPKYKYKRGEKPPFDLRKVALKELKNKFQRCHDIIWGSGEEDPATSFDEMSKLMFAKIFDEQRETTVGKSYKFQIGTNETPHSVAGRVYELYKKAQHSEPEVFKANIKLTDTKIYRVVETLQDISLNNTDLDAKGRAFEQFLSKYFRGEYGQFFTPRQIVEFMVEMVDPDESDLVIDPACGSGGFLLYVLKKVREKIINKYAGDERSINRIEWDFSHKRIFGIENNDRIARIAMMDMVIHEDGHSNIECHDALDFYPNFDPKKQIKSNKYSLVITNPPFGSSYASEDHPYFKKYDLAKNKPSQMSEILFIERCIDLLEEDGILGIVLPDSAFTNKGNIPVCNYITRKTKIIANISLPQFTFTPFGSDAKTSLLFLKKDKDAEKRYSEKEKCLKQIDEILGDDKLSKEEKDDKINKVWKSFSKFDYPIFMAHIEKIGHDATGREDISYMKDTLDQYTEFKKKPSGYSEAYESEEKWFRMVYFSQLVNKLDVEAYNPKYFEIVQEMNDSGLNITELKHICSGITPGVGFGKKDYISKGVPVIKTASVVKKENVGVIDWNKVDSFVLGKHWVNRTDKHIEKNDILVQSVAHMQAYIGDKIAVVRKIPKEYNNQALALSKFLIIRPDETKVNPYYLFLFLCSKFGKIQLWRYVRGMTAEIYEFDIENIFVTLPDRAIQDKIGNKAINLIDNLLKTEERVHRLKKELNELIEV